MEEINISAEEQDIKPSRKRKTSWKGTLAEDRQFVEHILQDTVAMNKAAMAGFSRSDLEKGLGLADAIVQADYDHLTRSAEKAQQYELFRQGLDNLRKTYQKHLKIARQLIDEGRELDRSQKLLLKGTRPHAIDAILIYVKQFYTFALEDKEIGQLFKAYNITPEIIEQMLRLTEEVSALRELAQRKDITATRAIKYRYDTQKAFYQWFRRFRIIYMNTPEPQKAAEKMVVKEK